MKATRVILLGVILAALMVPLAYAITFIGAVNYVASHGGNVTFTQTFQATSLTYPDGLSRFTNMFWDGQMRGNLGFDAAAGVNISVTEITRDSVTYIVTTALPGPVLTYVYYYRLVTMVPHITEPTSVTGGTYTYAGGITSVTTTGSPRTVVVTYGYGSGASSNLWDAADVLIGLIPFLALAMVINDVRHGELGPWTLWKTTLLVAVLAFMAWLIRSWGF